MGSVLIDASNLRVGGGVQVAASFIDEMAELRRDPQVVGRFPWLPTADIECSATVAESMKTNPSDLSTLRIVDRSSRELRRWIPVRDKYDVSFVVFGPEYAARRARRRIVGYADVRSVYPSPHGEVLSARSAWRWRLRGVLSRLLMRRPDQIVVETEAFGEQVAARGVASPERIVVVSNAYNATFDEPETWTRPGTLPDKVEADHVLAYVARGYAHKNHPFLTEVSHAANRAGVSVRFLVTLSEEHWDKQTPEFRNVCVNVGPLPVSMVPAVYEAADAAIFPSLLEAFSAMPLEAMTMGRVVFASDRDFVRTVCGDAAVYIDPLDPVSAATVIIKNLADRRRVANQIARGRELLDELPTARDRALGYLMIIGNEIED